MARYVGQTAPLTAQKCASAYNGVLFIDEAYQLNPYTGGRTDTFREECIAELIQQMENNRDKLVVIFAGYTAEMEEFLDKANTGLRSRIAKVIEFPDYTTDELLRILEGIAAGNQMTLDQGAREKARQIFDRARQDSARFGNARFARNLFERSLIQHAALTKDLPKGDPELYVSTGRRSPCPTPRRSPGRTGPGSDSNNRKRDRGASAPRSFCPGVQRSHFSMRARSWSANLPRSLLVPPLLWAMTSISLRPTSSSRW